MVVHHWQHNIRMNIFSDETSFSKTVLIDILLSDDVSINFFFSVPSLSYTLGVFTYQIHHYSTSTYQLYQCSSTSSLLINLIFLSIELGIFWQVPSYFRGSSNCLSFFRCCKCWLPFVRLSLHYKNVDNVCCIRCINK